MLTVECSGTPYEIGVQHGTAAKAHIERCIAFYAGLFEKTSKMDWPQVQDVARSFDAHIESTWPTYHEEIKGIAAGSGRPLLDIVALNVRTEIAFGKFSDGCTSLAWHTEKRAYLGQNWDWMLKQKENLFILKIVQAGKPSIQMVTEAGIIGKIGFNSAGVGVCLNAIKSQGMDPTRLPVHLALRMALESHSTKDALQSLEHWGIAAPGHILIADSTGDAVGFEFTSTTMLKLLPDAKGRVVHSNHLLLKHPGIIDTVWIKDSLFRVDRMSELTEDLATTEPTWAQVSRLFEDEVNAPTAICRDQKGESTSGTLFNIIMDLKQKTAVVRLGRPCQTEETDELAF
ncbi:peptidase C45 acyl-coenzyme A:6-aminopenicillanic acid acyl-transferase-like protein [Exophiala viscosa]|uniref:Peptidase C45 acyl-coenzyme A:6-aminopenicillanic acid acyl-transferase-like protein n=1 Tax=Exophiala viscosa TaxID=2486360 RepID=A0AAN6E685_9EURO|nr:peptidase C45 acyl-coenzyme A:6-aminopenicillanic acid acyl-transferase-like protein [Exophiala viscosa]KAI1627730.1 peptidase C45 acyl-coenzyme A:6-aminopenicillanic acid acyl-transferase-like protein [Exophiala viscosa]